MIEKEILPDKSYLLSDSQLSEGKLFLTVDYCFSIPRKPEELELEYDVVIIYNPKINNVRFDLINRLQNEEIEIDLEIDNEHKFIRIWTPSGLFEKIECDNFSVERKPLSKEQWIRKYQDLIVKFYEYHDKSENQRIKLRDFKNRTENLFRNDYENSIKKLEFLKDKSTHDLKTLDVKNKLTGQFLSLIEEGLKDL